MLQIQICQYVLCDLRQADSSIAKEKLGELVSLTSRLKATIDELGVKIEEVDVHAGDSLEHAHAYRDVIREIRTEKLVNKGFPDIDFFSRLY